MHRFASPEEAADHFATAFQSTASCVTEAAFTYPQAQPLDVLRALALGAGADVALGGGLYLYVSHHYVVVKDEDGFAVRTGAYYYSINSDDEGGEIGAWHWHPESRSWCVWPHLHTHAALGKHAPTGRTALEQVIRWLIIERGVSPHRPDWEELLDANEADWRDRRSWA